MGPHARHIAQRIAAWPADSLAGMRRGIEKESLRSNADGSLALTPHPAALGSALTHPHITTDFSESQLELDHRRACRHRALPRRIAADPRLRGPLDRRRDAVGVEHALRPAVRRDDTRRPLRQLEHRPRQERLPHRAGPPLRAAHADDLGHPLQLVDARPVERRLLRPDPQLQAPGLPADVSLRCIAGGVLELRGRPAARPAEPVRQHARPAPSHLAAHGAPGLPERCPVDAGRELQQPGQLRRFAARRVDAAPCRIRGHRRAQSRWRIQPAGDDAAADRERVLRQHPPETRDRQRRAAAACAALARRGVHRGAVP